VPSALTPRKEVVGDIADVPTDEGWLYLAFEEFLRGICGLSFSCVARKFSVSLTCGSMLPSTSNYDGSSKLMGVRR
jgi:hypothetical protein